MSLRGGRKPDVAIRSKNVSIIWKFRVKTVVFKDADCHGHKWPRNDIAYLIPDSWPENPSNTGAFGCAKLFGKFLFDGLIIPNPCRRHTLVISPS